jgi:hypothetical protein
MKSRRERLTSATNYPMLTMYEYRSALEETEPISLSRNVLIFGRGAALCWNVHLPAAFVRRHRPAHLRTAARPLRSIHHGAALGGKSAPGGMNEHLWIDNAI